MARAQAAGLDPTYDNLRMPNETRNYVPKLLAVRNIINNPQAFSVNLAKIDNKPYFQAINVEQPLDIQSAARLANISTNEFLALNPSFNGPVFVPKNNRKMLLPISAINTFENNYRKADKSSLLSWNLYTTLSNTNVADLAMQSGMSASEIKRLNGISGNTIAAGRSVLLSKNSMATPALSSFANNDSDDLLRPAMAKADMAPVLPARSLANVKVNVPATPVQAVPLLAQAPVTAAAPIRTTQLTQIAALPSTPAITISQAPVSAAPATVLAQAMPAAPINSGSPEISRHESVASISNTPISNTTLVDPLLTLAQESSLKLNAAESVQDALAKAEMEENRQARLAQARAERAAKLAANAVKNDTDDERAPKTHKVASGETLFAIAQRYNLNVADLVTANRLKGSNIHAGQVLNVALDGRNTLSKSSSVRQVSYTVKRGDTLTSIAAQLNMPVSSLQKLNKGENIRPGQKIKLTNL